MENNILNRMKIGISLKTSMITSVVILILLTVSSLVFIRLESSLSKVMIDNYVQMQEKALESHSETQRLSLGDRTRINSEICGGISESFLYNFDSDRLNALLKTFMKLPSIQAIQVLDSDNAPFAAAWKTPAVVTGEKIPANIALDENSSFKSASYHEKEQVGMVRVYYTDKLLVEEIRQKEELIKKEILNFRDIAEKSINNAISIQVVVTICIVAALIATIVLSLQLIVVRPIKNTVAMIRDIAEGEGDLTKRLHADRKDELGELAKWFNNFVEKLQGIIGEVATSAESVSTSSASLSEISNAMSQEADSLSGKSNTVATAAEEMSANMNSVAAASEEAATNVNVVTASTGEMTNTVNEILRNSEEANSVTEEAVGQAGKALEKINELGRAATEITKVTEVITDISEQTNLLALNATIEAARAGEAGRGFAVVANEIKELAKQTAEATLEIKDRVSGIQGATQESVSEIKRISDIIGNVNKSVTTISTAIEEQSVTTKEISENIGQASLGIEEVNENVAQSSTVAEEIAKDIADVNRSADEMSSSSSQLDINSNELFGLADHLKQMVGKFKV
ncbi:MAG: methyl-accepting chemotaxis protein [Desulfobacteraceae bacterium]|nr:methyl-accepting chemotaxis protein [Desulfobacteraceae bacterium]